MGRESGGELPHGAAAGDAVSLSPTSPMQPAQLHAERMMHPPLEQGRHSVGAGRVMFLRFSSRRRPTINTTEYSQGQGVRWRATATHS